MIVQHVVPEVASELHSRDYTCWCAPEIKRVHDRDLGTIVAHNHPPGGLPTGWLLERVEQTPLTMA